MVERYRPLSPQKKIKPKTEPIKRYRPPSSLSKGPEGTTYVKGPKGTTYVKTIGGTAVGKYITTKGGSQRFRAIRPRKPHHLYFTDTALGKLKPKKKQYLVWDAWADERQRGPDIAKGLCVLVSPGGVKSFRCVYYFPGSPAPHYVHLGRCGEMSLAEARQRCREARALARQGKDPKAGDPAKSGTFETVFRDWVEREQVGRRQNKSALKTQGFVLANVKPLLARPVAAIQYSEIERLLDKIRDGDGDKTPRPAAALRIFAHLRDFFSWCARRDGPIQISPIQGMSAPTTAIGSDRVYSDDELRAIWRAADKLDHPLEGGYVKLIFLLALRREELAQAKWSEFDDAEAPTLFTVPFERTKGKATRKPISYFVPLPPLAARIIRSLPRHDAEAVFKRLDFARLRDRLVAAGAPAGFKLHVARHTVATWLQNKGYSEWERGLVLNHASGGVTAGYSHGHSTDLKRKLLEEWADCVGKLVQPDAGVAVLL